MDTVDVHDAQDHLRKGLQCGLFRITEWAIEVTSLNHPEAYARHDVKRLDTLTWNFATQERYDLNRMLRCVATIQHVLLHDFEDIVCSCVAPNESVGGETQLPKVQIQSIST